MKLNILFLVTTIALVASCSSDSENIEENDNVAFSLYDDVKLINHEVPEDDLKALQDLGYSGSLMKTFKRTDKFSGESFNYYLIDNHIEIKKSQLKYLNQNHSNSLGRNSNNKNVQSQYRTTNIANRRYYIIIALHVNGSTNRQGIRDAVANYNALNLGGLNFRLEFSNATSIYELQAIKERADILILQGGSGKGGKSGFPYANGDPYDSISLFSGTSQEGVDIVEQVITHEIGHCIGLRHTDYFARINCEITGDEGQSSVGAIHIPGTPEKTNIDLNSVMRACYSPFSTGEFTNYDIIALEEIF